MTTQPAEPGPQGFYVSIQRDSRTRLLLGPHGTKEEADGRVELGRQLAERFDPFTGFDSFGVTRLQGHPGDELPRGVLNEMADQEAQ